MATAKAQKDPNRGAGGKFVAGHARTGGRKKGSRNKNTVDIKEALLAAGEYLGREGGLTQFFIDIGKQDPKTVGGWIVDLLPRDINKVDANGDAAKTPAMVINIVGVASGVHLSKAECEQAMRDQLPPLLEHAPLVIDHDDDDELPPAA